ncbi:MAG: enoyl-CoA hydratase-related protein [Actinomycetota bacterium]
MTHPETALPYPGSTIFFHDRPAPGVLRLWLDTGLAGNAITHENHREFSTIWPAVATDDEARVVIVQGGDGALCEGGDLSFLPPLLDDGTLRATVRDDIVALVRNIIECPKPIITAIEGTCTGGGLAMALMADIPVAARSAVLVDAHVVAGLACGDHAAFAWPLLMGMAKAKYHLLTARPLTADEAERNGLIARCVDDADLHDDVLDIATTIARYHPDGVSLTKRSAGGWYQMAMPIFEMSASHEASGFAGDGVRELLTRAGMGGTDA